MQRLPRARRAHGAERRAVLDEPLLAAVVPDEMRDLVHVRMGAGRERREADRRQRREGRDGAAVAAVLGEQRERRRVPSLERVLEHRRREAVDDDEDQLLPVVNPWQACAARRSARPGYGGAAAASAGSADGLEVADDRHESERGEPDGDRGNDQRQAARACRRAAARLRRRSRRRRHRPAPRPRRRRSPSSRRSRRRPVRLRRRRERPPRARPSGVAESRPAKSTPSATPSPSARPIVYQSPIDGPSR